MERKFSQYTTKIGKKTKLRKRGITASRTTIYKLPKDMDVIEYLRLPFGLQHCAKLKHHIT